MRKARLRTCLTALLSLSLFILIAATLDRAAPVDGAVSAALFSLRSPLLTSFFIGCTSLASTVWLLVLALCITLLLRRHRAYRVPLLGCLLMAVLINVALKSAFTRERPDALMRLVSETGFSFPSGHAMVSTAFYGFLACVARRVWPKGRKRACAVGLCVAAIALVCVSRVYLGVHYFTDVLGGACLSLTLLSVYTFAVDAYVRMGENALLRTGAQKESIRLVHSFRYALQGVVGGLQNERNMVIHFAAMATVVVFGAILEISRAEWLVCLALFGMVFMAELMNTAVETIVDMITQKPDPRAKLAKDTAAGAVLAAALMAAVAGAIIFVPKLYQALMAGK